MKKSFSKRQFVFCSLSEQEVPVENESGCCEFYNSAHNKCEYKKYSHRSGHTRLSEREEIYLNFSSRDDDEGLEQ